MTKALSINKIFFLTFVLGVFLFIYYILQVGALSRDIYLLDECEKKFSSLSNNTKLLDISFSRAKSLRNMEGYLKEKDFVKPRHVNYIRVIGSSVASKSP